MVNYSNSKIYKIVDNTNDNIYIGSTVKTLTQRLAQHKYDYKKYLEGQSHFITSFKILENDNYDIILLEEFKTCENKEQLHARERHYIDTLKCVNKTIPSRTKAEYYLATLEHSKQRSLNNYYKNIEHIKEVKNEKIWCECCKMNYTHSNRARHFKSQRHITNSTAIDNN